MLVRVKALHPTLEQHTEVPKYALMHEIMAAHVALFLKGVPKGEYGTYLEDEVPGRGRPQKAIGQERHQCD